MMTILVSCQDKLLTFKGQTYPCRIGKAGFIDGNQGREGDAKTPLGTYRLRFGFYRADRLPAPPGNLVFHTIQLEDGWCDDPESAAYNRYIRLPSQESHEKMWRDDGVYDVVLVMDHNDSPPQAPLGSAVFMHIAQPDNQETLGCIAVTPDVMAHLLPHLSSETIVKITA